MSLIGWYENIAWNISQSFIICLFIAQTFISRALICSWSLVNLAFCKSMIESIKHWRFSLMSFMNSIFILLILFPFIWFTTVSTKHENIFLLCFFLFFLIYIVFTISNLLTFIVKWWFKISCFFLSSWHNGSAKLLAIKQFLWGPKCQTQSKIFLIL